MIHTQQATVWQGRSKCNEFELEWKFNSATLTMGKSLLQLVLSRISSTCTTNGEESQSLAVGKFGLTLTVRCGLP